jgi:uncharacterized CHY-type Zn-finger protein
MKKQSESKNVSNTITTIVCKHCGEPINEAMLIGLSLICPLCNKPQNGHQSNAEKPNNASIICKHCGKNIDQAEFRGFSLICPLCKKPQNGEQHTNNEL